MKTWHTYARWVLLGVLTAGLLYEGGMKVAGEMTAQFVAWGFPAWFVYVVGGAQLLGALGLFHHSTVRFALLVLTVVTIAAILTIAGKHASYPDVKSYVIALLWPILYLLDLFALMYLKAKRDGEEGRWGLL